MKSILLVDDDEDDRNLFKEAVNFLDSRIQCWTANDGQEALDVLTYELVVLPDLIFLDLNMPKMNGHEMLSILKQHRQFKKLPVIYTTSSNPDDTKKCTKAGATGFVTKPSDFHELIKTLTSVFNTYLVPLYSDH